MPAPSEKPAVLHVLEAMEGGTCRHVSELLPGLAARGYPVALATSFRRDPALADAIVPAFAECGIALHELPMRRAVSPLADLCALTRLKRLIQTLAPGIIHTHSSKAGFLGRLAGAAQGVPVVHTPHAFPFLMEGSRAKRRLYRLLERLVQPKTAALIAVSHEEVQAAHELGFPPGRIHHIPNGTRYPAAAAAAVAPAAVAPRQAIGFFGRLCRQKGADVLLRAVAGMDVEACIYGNGEDGAAVREHCRRLRLGHRVRFMGGCPQGEVVDAMRGCAVIAVPSRWEGFPYVVLDAYAAGVPVVAARVGGIPDMVQDGVTGVLVPPDDAPALAAALAALLNNPPRRHALAAAARKLLPSYALDTMVDNIACVYRAVWNAKRD